MPGLANAEMLSLHVAQSMYSFNLLCLVQGLSEVTQYTVTADSVAPDVVSVG